VTFFVIEEKIDGSARSHYFAGKRRSPGTPAEGHIAMQLKEIIAQLEYYTGAFPREALARAIEERERIIPELLDIIKRASDNPQELDADPDYIGHIYAMFLLSQFREKGAYEPIVQFFSHPGELSLDLTGDVVTENLDSMLASVSCGDDRLIKTLIENPEANEWVRGSALRSLVILVLTGELTRDSVIEYFGSLFREKLPREPSNAWDCLVACAMDLYPEELYLDIERSFQEELVDTSFVNRQNVRQALDQGMERTLARLREDRTYRLIEDTIAETEWWACFQPEKDYVPKKKPKIGRNQPCPCGSGKKYKKCCGKPEMQVMQ
jgi:hypothetical protein